MNSKIGLSKLILKALFKASLAFFLGLVFSIFSMGWAMHLFVDGSSGGMGGHGAVLVILLAWFYIAPWPGVLFLFSLLAPFLYAFAAWKIAMGSFFQWLLMDYLNDPIRSFADRSSRSVYKYLDKIQNSEHIQDLSTFQKKILHWFFRKTPFLSDPQKEVDLKLQEGTDRLARLPMRMFWLLFTLHLGLLLMASVMY